MVLGNGKIDLKIAKTALNKLEIDELGLDEIDRKILETMVLKYQEDKTYWNRGFSNNSG